MEIYIHGRNLICHRAQHLLSLQSVEKHLFFDLLGANEQIEEYNRSVHITEKRHTRKGTFRTFLLLKTKVLQCTLNNKCTRDIQQYCARVLASGDYMILCNDIFCVRYCFFLIFSLVLRVPQTPSCVICKWFVSVP